MKQKKIKIFLGGYINAINAQNLNCRSLALHLDRDRFDVGVLTYPGGRLEMGPEFDDVKKFRLLAPLYKPLRWVRHLAYLRGLLWCDVAYLPKGEIYGFCQRVARRFGKKTFVTVEGVITGDNYKKAVEAYGSPEGVRCFYNGYDHTFSITRFMSTENEKAVGIKSEDVLYLGVESDTFKCTRASERKELKNIVFIGSNLKHKRIEEFIALARRFPEISFHAAGDPAYSGGVEQAALPNLTFHGRLPHEELAKLLAQMDLHVFTSRSEGFPKVTLETAAAGVPSIVYGDYGAAQWIKNGKDGYVVEEYNEIVDIIANLNAHPEKLADLSAGAEALGRRFDWSVLIKDWERAIEGIVAETQKGTK